MLVLEDFYVVDKEGHAVCHDLRDYFSFGNGINRHLLVLLVIVILGRELFWTFDLMASCPLFKYVLNLLQSWVIMKGLMKKYRAACIARTRAPTGFTSLKSPMTSGNLARYASPSVRVMSGEARKPYHIQVPVVSDRKKRLYCSTRLGKSHLEIHFIPLKYMCLLIRCLGKVVSSQIPDLLGGIYLIMIVGNECR
jgi:hypothetical protein